MGLVESHPTISIKCCTSKKDIVRHMTQHSNNDEDHHSELRGIRNFVVSNKALTSVVSVDMKRPNRQSLLDYQDRIRCKIARQFASAPNELSIVHITDENSGEVLGLIRIESASKTKEVTLSILKPRHDNSDSISSSSSSSSPSSSPFPLSLLLLFLVILLCHSVSLHPFSLKNCDRDEFTLHSSSLRNSPVSAR
jgi:hypothetical protein